MQTEQLVRSAQAGDGDSREALARAWLPVVYGVALARTRNRAAAEDLTQEAFFRAFAKLETLRNPARFGPWILRIVKNAARDLARRGEHRTRVAAFDPPSPEEPLPGENAAVDAWRGLPEEERLVCWLKVMQDLSLREIASLIGSSKSAVGRLYSKGLARMRRELSHVRV
ncbi:MAG: sigma-70 family RNA polymerase sigma factor [Planctomycetota bacterium]|nr:sigma-70 family RNA polymerase sigma factor [Planctomycetota bacterium]